MDNRAHIGNEELEKAGFLKVNDRVKQLKLGHVFKIKQKTCPYYLATNFQNLNDDENRIVTRGKANNFYKPRICTETFAYTAIDDWNSLPNNVKGIKSIVNSRSFEVWADLKSFQFSPVLYSSLQILFN